MWSKKTIVGASLVIAAFLYARKSRRAPRAARDVSKGSGGRKRKDRVRIDKEFFNRMRFLLKIAVPGWKSQEFGYLVLLSLALCTRTALSIYLAAVNGGVVKGIVQRDLRAFLGKIATLGMVALPASFVNSLLSYLQQRLAVRFRVRLTHYFMKKYMDRMTFYKVTNLDGRISNPDQRLTQDVQKWATSLSLLYNNFTKPLLDIILFSRRLADLLGWKGPGAVIGWYFVSGVIIRFISPPFGRLTAEEQRLEGDYRAAHSRLLTYCEEISFYGGNRWERKYIMSSFSRLLQHVNAVLYKRLFMGVFDGFLVKYGAVMVGYTVVGLPVFGPDREAYLASIGDDPSAITRDYVRNSSLLINLARAIGRIVTSYKETQRLAGYTSLVFELKQVLDDLAADRYERQMVAAAAGDDDDAADGSKPRRFSKPAGKVATGDSIVFDDCAIVTPNGDLLVEHLSFSVQPGMNLMIVGPNGCGKSSLFRMLGELWPLFEGVLTKPTAAQDIFYIPQKPYMSLGTLRDQVIYPHLEEDMARHGETDESLLEQMRAVHLMKVYDREGGWDAVGDWGDKLSGGEKQRIAMARLFYHRPRYAILDECTSAVSMDVEGFLYTHCRELGITLITVSHRASLWKYHEYILELDGNGGWEFGRMEEHPRYKEMLKRVS